MLIHDSTCWPIGLTVAQGAATMEQHLLSLQSWNDWFERRQPFHVVRVYLDGDAIHHSRDIGKATKQWMKEGAADQITTWVRSMLIVVPMDQYERMKNMSVEKVFGIPGGLFPTLDDACNWLNARLDKPGGAEVDRRTLDQLKAVVEQREARKA